MKTYFIIELKQSKNFKGTQLNFKEYAMTRNSFTNLQDCAKRFTSQEAAEKYANKWFKDFIGEISVISYVIY